MRIGYVGTNLGLGTKTRTFRLAGFTIERARETALANIADILTCLRWNAERDIRFYRITSNIIPFASHPVSNGWEWEVELRDELAEIGRFAAEQGIRLGTHPGQYTLINAPRPEVVAASVAELTYHSTFLDTIGAPQDARMQIHVGGIYGEKEASMQRWIEVFPRLPERIRWRLSIENDERLYGLQDCLKINEAVGIPIIFDVFHHSLLNEGEGLPAAYDAVRRTWDAKTTGPIQLDYSSQNADKRFGAHTDSIDEADFARFLETAPSEADVMLEIKDKETSAMKALAVIDPSRGPYIPPAPPEKPKRGRKKAEVQATDGESPGDEE